MLVIGIPAFNEEENIAKIILNVQSLVDKIVVCNDGSNDLTGQIAEKMGAIVINHEKNLGYGAAIRSMFLKASELDADIFVTFDADGQHRIEDISKLLKPIYKNEADIVIGSRFLDNETEIPKYRRMGIKVITKLTNISSEVKITDSQSGLRAYNKKTIQEISPSDYGMGISTEILIKANKKNLKIKEVPIKILYEGDTSTHHPVSHGVSVIFSTMKFISIEHPLKFYGVPGIIFLFIGLFFTVWTIQAFTDTRQIFTNLALIGVGSIILGTILSMTAIILFSMVNVVRERKS
jgi:glycosyltransferase involved in cell wall biosynthesis